MDIKETKLNKGIYYFGLVMSILSGIGWILLANHIYHEHFKDGGVPEDKRDSLSYTHNKLIWGFGIFMSVITVVPIIIYIIIRASSRIIQR